MGKLEALVTLTFDISEGEWPMGEDEAREVCVYVKNDGKGPGGWVSTVSRRKNGSWSVRRRTRFIFGQDYAEQVPESIRRDLSDAYDVAVASLPYTI
jgi:hypothetical protein